MWERIIIGSIVFTVGCIVGVAIGLQVASSLIGLDIKPVEPFMVQLKDINGNVRTIRE